MGSSKPLTGKSILVVEDEPLIALDTIEALQSEGATAITARNLDDAFTRLQSNQISAALLDVNLGATGNCEAMCHHLERVGIPFGFYTGYRNEPLMLEWANVPVVSKPATRQELIRTMNLLVATN
jgi:CheY-like chemotaxis protein